MKTLLIASIIGIAVIFTVMMYGMMCAASMADDGIEHAYALMQGQKGNSIPASTNTQECSGGVCSDRQDGQTTDAKIEEMTQLFDELSYQYGEEIESLIDDGLRTV